jgi:ABC-type branched-subunit amino acid transport system substrate-binding protein
VLHLSAQQRLANIENGVVSPISGSAALAGKYIVNGVKLLENELNAAGGVIIMAFSTD